MFQFLGFVEVESSKGTETVKEAIRKMKFNKQIKKAEGQKTPKVELTISVDGVTVQEPKYKVSQRSEVRVNGERGKNGSQCRSSSVR